MKLLFSTMLAFLVACGGGGGDLVEQTAKQADGACACKDYECTRPFIAELNRISVKEDKKVKELAPDRAQAYHEEHRRAADCQNKLRKK